MAGLFQATSKQRNPLGTTIRTHGSGKYTFGLALSAGQYPRSACLFYQLLAVCGIFLTNVINYIIASYGSRSWDVNAGWRWMLRLGAIPAAAFLLSMVRAPESPRFLIQAGKTEEGFAVLEHIIGTEQARLRTDDIHASVKLETEMSHEFHDLFRPGLQKALIIGTLIKA